MRKFVYWFVYVLIVGLILAGIVVAVLHFRHKDTKPKTTAGNSISKSTPKIADSGKSDSSSKSSTKPAQTPTTTPPTTPSTTNTTTPTATAQLSNTGPGDVVALFMGVVVLGTVSFSLYQRKAL